MVRDSTPGARVTSASVPPSRKRLTKKSRAHFSRPHHYQVGVLFSPLPCLGRSRRPSVSSLPTPSHGSSGCRTWRATWPPRWYGWEEVLSRIEHVELQFLPFSRAYRRPS